ncbi:hypothetical protein DYB32_000461 [Aphanomyces invadans]|uniref:Uncharacterized protein n=1 Tax=Aphanomyces invadans TaxID=157072 RepID=A0A418B9Y9_9STRA|nr:hypothetical protein DYB32_000461 [Aphanomyces invadans]
MDLQVGQRCEISGKRRGEIAYIGAVQGIPPGEWVGVRLDMPFGKNDGSQGSQRYFDCKPLHGVFVRPDSVNVSGEFPPFLVVHDDVSLEEKVRLVEDARAAQREQTSQRQKAQVSTTSGTSRAEAVDAFWSEFSEKEANVWRTLDTIEGSSTNVSSALDALCTHMHALRDLAAAATLYLPPYDIRATQALTQRLMQAIEAKRTALAPRKKFTFKARAKLKTAGGIPLPPPPPPLVPFAPSNPAHDHELEYADQAHAVLHITAADSPDLSLARLSHCIVVIRVPTSAVRGTELSHCTIYTGPIHGSLWLENCSNCTFVVACRQLRVHHTTSSSFYLRVKSHPIIEDCATLGFTSYALQYDGLAAQLDSADLATDTGLWAQVHDFKWLRQTPSPHWRVLDDRERVHGVDPKVASLVSLESN